MISSDSEIVKLNVGGKSFVTFKKTLLTAPWFETFFSGKFKKPDMINNEYFVDRDPTIFLDVLNYLRDGKTIQFSNFENKKHFNRFVFECEYFGITIENTWEKLLYTNSKIIKLNVKGEVFIIAKSVLQGVKWFEAYFSNTPVVINNNEYVTNIVLDEFRVLFEYCLHKDKKVMYFQNINEKYILYNEYKCLSKYGIPYCYK